MALFKNMKIRAKLFSGFILLLAIMGFIAVFGAIQLNNASTEYNYVLGYPAARLVMLGDVELNMMDARRVMNRATAYAAIPDAAEREISINRSRSELGTIRADVLNNLDRLDHSLRTDEYLPLYRINAQLGRTANVRTQVLQYIDVAAITLFDNAIIGDFPAALININESAAIMAIATAYIAETSESANEFMDEMLDSLATLVTTTTTTSIILALVAIGLGIAVAVIVSSAITKPVGRLVELVKNISKGNLAVNVNKSDITRDEIGGLTQDMTDLVATIRNIMSDLSTFSHESSVKGDIEYRMDATKYRGEYREMVTGINEFADNFVKDMLTLIGILDNIGNGEFNFAMEQLPGKKIIVNQKVDVLKSNLANLALDINTMIDSAAVKGDLNFKLKENQYKGGWQELIAGLNTFAATVDAPIVEIKDVMVSLARGEFSKKVSGKYAGDFMSIQNAVNGTIDTLASTISEVSSTLSGIASGDLTRTITREYNGDFAEIKASINNIATTLQKAMGEISAASNYVLEGAKRITTNALELAEGSSTQAASLEELNTSVELIKAQTVQFADNAREANQLSNKSTSNAHEGNEAMKQMLSAMMQIRESSNNISVIIKVIQDIAFQTNLLSLNAAVEAARAGEHGKGFGVVAEEVRNLAARSQGAAAETTTLIQDSIARVESGTQIANTTSESLDTIVTNATEVLNLINNITTAANEQADMITQISEVLLHTANTVQSNSKFAQESAATAEELNSQSEMLQQLVSYFKL